MGIFNYLVEMLFVTIAVFVLMVLFGPFIQFIFEEWMRLALVSIVVGPILYGIINTADYFVKRRELKKNEQKEG